MLRRRPRHHRWARIFVDDLTQACEDLFAALGGPELSLPISIPIDGDGVVLLQPGGPIFAPRVPATMAVVRRGDGTYAVDIARDDGGHMVIPGFEGSALPGLAYVIAPDGLDIGPPPLPGDETTAGALATALFITIKMKLAKVGHPGP